jgi:TRAP-type C4-dicarboxylate transport system substrate-binding protein
MLDTLRMGRSVAIRLLSAAALLGSAAIPSQAQEKVLLKIADIFPTTHYIVTKGTQVWMDKAVELSGGRIQFQYFPAQQLGKAADILSLTQSGVADIGAVAPAYVPAKMPLTAAGELPHMFDSACAGSYALTKLAQPDGLLGKAEYTPQHVRLLFANMLAPYTVMTSEAPLNSYKGLKGLKIYASGGAKDVTLRTLGAVPIRLTGPELFQAVQRHTIDGTMLSYNSLRPYDLQPMLKYGLTGVNLGSTAITYIISEQKWASLPKDIQDILLKSADFASKSLCHHSDSANKSEMEALEAMGAKVHVIAGDEKADLLKVLEPVRSEWASNLDKNGKPAAEIANTFKKLVQEYPGD